jgi:hypothetical protein
VKGVGGVVLVVTVVIFMMVGIMIWHVGSSKVTPKVVVAW